MWIGSGVAGGVLGSCLVAGFAGTIASAAAGMGQELLNASILFLAVGMLGWHNVWMSKHGREMAQHASALGKAVESGERPLYALAIVVGMAVLREGSELVLFLYSIAIAGDTSRVDFVLGGLLGLAGGIGIGAGLYAGLLRIPMRYLFTVISWLILLLAAGLASQGAQFLMQADILPPLNPALWDTSALLSDDGIPGKIMHTLVGYVARPAGIQVIFWVATLVVIGGLTRANAGPQPPKGLMRGVAGAALIALVSLAIAASHI
jgi:high-affinity iron transporter